MITTDFYFVTAKFGEGPDITVHYWVVSHNNKSRIYRRLRATHQCDVGTVTFLARNDLTITCFNI